MVESLRSRTIHGLSWSFIESAGLQGVRFIIGIVLARVLLPAEFGLIGMLMIFMSVAQAFLDGGFGAALIQKRDATIADTSSIFYFNILVGVLAAGILCLASPWIAAFYQQPILTPLARAMSLVIVINSFGLIHITILQKEIDFKRFTKVSLMASVLSGIIGVVMAVEGFGVWSLVTQQVSGAFFQTLLLWLMNSWRPRLTFRLRSLRQMFSFGSRMLASGLIDQIFNNVYPVTIGKLFSATDLGFFTRARAFQELPSNTLSGIVGRVTFSVFSSIQDDSARLKRGLKKALTTLVLVNFPMMIGLSMVARPLVLVLLTEKWAECIPYLQLLCFYGLLYPVHLINLNILQALGKSRLFLRLEIIKKVLIVITIFVTWRWGISAMIYGMIVFSIIAYYLNSYYTGILVGYPIQEQLHDLLPYLIMSLLMGIAVYGVGLLPFGNHWSMLLVQTGVGTAMYVCLCRRFRLTAFMEIWKAGCNRVALLRTGSPG